jgi:hypothetical protein
MLRGRLRGSCKHFVNSKSSVAERTGSYAVRVRELLTKLNHRPFRKRDGSRATAFEAIDKPALKPLSMEPFDLSEWSRARVNIDYHVTFGSSRLG